VSHVNVLTREVAAKIVFYGPGLSGKTTTLRKLHDTVRPAHRGEMMSIATEGDRTLFFDFLPMTVERVGDHSVRLALYTVPGQVFYNATRKLVLQGADGVVFVADSQPEAMDSNRESLSNLEENLLEQGIRLDRFPLVMQWNKRDLDKSLSLDELRRVLNPRGVPEVETVAAQGRGVLEVLKQVTRLVIRELRAKHLVPPVRPLVPAGTQLEEPGGGAGIEQQLHQHLDREAAPTLRKPRQRLGIREPASPGLRGAATVLAPPLLLEHARAAEAAFAAGDPNACVQAVLGALEQGLAASTQDSWAVQAYALGMHGPDVLRLHAMAARGELRPEDAAFALYVLMQLLVRMRSTAD